MVARFPLQDKAFYRTQRQIEVSRHPELMGLHHLEVDEISADRWQLKLYFISASNLPSKQWLPAQLLTTNILLVTVDGTNPPLTVTSVRKDKASMFFIIDVAALPNTSFNMLTSDFILEIINVPDIDPELTKLFFSLSKNSQIDPKPLSSLPPELSLAKAIDYQAKDYSSFRSLMLDQLSQSVPQWQERHAADLGMALVEVLAYTADYLSYYQDAVATESYLGTARRRISLRRHARLVNYTLSEGCNARVWVHITVKPGATDVALPAKTPLLTPQPWIQQLPGTLTRERYSQLCQQSGEQLRVFETLEDTTLCAAHNTLSFYTAGARTFHLEPGATSAQLDGHVPGLAPGSVLIFETVLSLSTGHPNEANRRQRHVVRLQKQAAHSYDRLHNHPITLIHWFREDAIPFTFTIAGCSTSGRYLENVSVARGNIVLADYGTTIADEPLSPVPLQGNYYPQLKFNPLTHGVPYSVTVAKTTSAKQTLTQNLTDARPAIRLWENHRYHQHVLWPPTISVLGEEDALPDQPRNQWVPQPDLLGRSPFEHAFVVETENDGSPYLRFGNGDHGKKPTVNHVFTASYRIGNGQEGNIGPETIRYIVTDDPRVVGVRNPMPAQGGVDPEPIEHARLRAPEAFRVEQPRCVTETDYVTTVERYPGVLSAIARREWMGSRSIMAIYIARKGGEHLDQDFVDELATMLAPFKMAGTDFQIFSAKKVSLTIKLTIVVNAHVFRRHVHKVLQLAFSNVRFPNGEQGFFYPDNFTLGQALYLSKVIAHAKQAEGVINVVATTFCRYSQATSNKKLAEVITMSPLEMIQVQNIAASPQSGSIQFELEGGL